MRISNRFSANMDQRLAKESNNWVAVQLYTAKIKMLNKTIDEEKKERDSAIPS